jgi:hypothetical protein
LQAFVGDGMPQSLGDAKCFFGSSHSQKSLWYIRYSKKE